MIWYLSIAKYFYLSNMFFFMTPFERSLSKLSENHKIVEIECTELKLWQLKESPNHAALIIECKEWNFRQHEF